MSWAQSWCLFLPNLHWGEGGGRLGTCASSPCDWHHSPSGSVLGLLRSVLLEVNQGKDLGIVEDE